MRKGYNQYGQKYTSFSEWRDWGFGTWCAAIVVGAQFLFFISFIISKIW
jgi:hypothetical protein